jgi:microsomal dipeptidase-like Zn-dependent dipeptidase
MRFMKNAPWALLFAACAVTIGSNAQVRMGPAPAPPMVQVPIPPAAAQPPKVQVAPPPGAAMPPKVQISQPLHGWADLHTHPMSYLGFGGKVIAGGVDVGSFLPADGSCNHGVTAASMEQALGNDNAIHGGWDAFHNGCGDNLRNTVINELEKGNQALNPPEGGRGASDFANWPVWNDITHQKMWVDWIRRAKYGGQHVMVALAVNNKTLGDAVVGPGDAATDDVTSADLQTRRMKEFVGRHTDFMEIAYSAADLERIVRADKLAIVLGMEVDNIGNFNKVPGVNEAMVALEVQRLYGEGIRYIFPIHVIDNPFGGTAVYEGGFNTSNYREAGHFWNLECAKPGDRILYQYQPGGLDVGVALARQVKLGIDGFRNPPTPPSCPGSGHQNALGLTPLGEFAIKEMMRHGMMIDIDHMSQKSANRALDIAEAVAGGGYPVMSGHNGVRGRNGYDENKRTVAQLHRIAALHGMFGLGSAASEAYTWIQQYALAVADMPANASLPNYGAVAMGTDLNGLVKGPRPRNGSAIAYSPFFPQSELGTHKWDYNKDGVAHYGMLAEFLKDAATAPGGANMVENYLNHSADYFWQTWLKCDAQKGNVH